MSRFPVFGSAALAALSWGILGSVEAIILRPPHAIPGSGDPWLQAEALVLCTIAGFGIGLAVRLLCPRSEDRVLPVIGPLFIYLLLFALYEVNRRIAGSFFTLAAVGASIGSTLIIAALFRYFLRWLSGRFPEKLWIGAILLLFTAALFLAFAGSSDQEAVLRTASSHKPNVILITMDTTRVDSLSVYGYYRNTSPNLRKIVAGGTIFEKAYTVASWTLPSHASLFTGELPSVHGADYSYFWLDSSERTIAEILQEKGYDTAGFIGGPFLLSTLNMAQGFSYYDDQLDFASGIQSLMLMRVVRRVTGLQPFWMDRQRSARDTTDRVLRWLGRAEKSQPFFLFINYFDPHDPYTPPHPFDTLYDPEYHGPMNGATRPLYSNRETGERKKGGKDGVPLAREDYKHLKALYDGEITYMDHEMGRLFDALDQKGLLKNSILIVTADHGESIGEHHLVDHGHTLYDEQIRIPFILAGPGVPSGKRVSRMISNIDVLPTVLELLHEPAPEHIQGKSFASALSNGADSGERYYGEIFEDPHTRVNAFKRDLKALIDADMKLIHSSTSGPELFNLGLDPLEQSNLSASEPQAENDLSGKMKQVLQGITPKTGRKQAPLDQSTLESLKANGYIN